MGRHQRVGAAGAAERVGAAGAAEEQHSAAPATAGAARSHRRARRGTVPVRTGLLGVSAAVAMGAVAVASGLIPGGDSYSSGDGRESGRVQSAGSPTGVETQGGLATTPDQRQENSASRGSERPEPSSSAPSSKTEEPAKSPSPEKSAADTGTDKKSGEARGEKTAEPERSVPARPGVPQSPDTGQAAETEVLSLVNQERAKAGCSPVRADAALADLAADFSEDMAERGFFDHTDPTGATPWDRADKAGIANLGGENIARGQANAQSVMDSWMNSTGHRANILNCDYKTLGVGAHFAPGGPWWTQDFGF